MSMQWAETSFDSLPSFDLTEPTPMPCSNKVDSLGDLAAYMLGSPEAPSSPVMDGVVPQGDFSLGFDALDFTAIPTELAVNVKPVILPEVHQNNKRSLDARWSDEQLDMSNADLRRHLKVNPMSDEDVKALKEARRRKKNREYAKKARTKRLAKQSNIAVNHSALKADNEKLTVEISQLRSLNASLQSQQQKLLYILAQQVGEAEAHRLAAEL